MPMSVSVYACSYVCLLLFSSATSPKVMCFAQIKSWKFNELSHIKHTMKFVHIWSFFRFFSRFLQPLFFLFFCFFTHTLFSAAASSSIFSLNLLCCQMQSKEKKKLIMRNSIHFGNLKIVQCVARPFQINNLIHAHTHILTFTFTYSHSHIRAQCEWKMKRREKKTNKQSNKQITERNRRMKYPRKKNNKSEFSTKTQLFSDIIRTMGVYESKLCRFFVSFLNSFRTNMHIDEERTKTNSAKIHRNA